MCTLRINNPEIQTKYREYQQKQIAEHPYMFIAMNMILVLFSIVLFIVKKFLEPRFVNLEGNPIKLRENFEFIEASQISLIISGSTLLIVLIGLYSSRRWLFCTELIFPAIVLNLILVMHIYPGNVRQPKRNQVQAMS